MITFAFVSGEFILFCGLILHTFTKKIDKNFIMVLGEYWRENN